MSLPERLPKQSMPETDNTSLLLWVLSLSFERKGKEMIPRTTSYAVKAEARTILQYV